MKKLIFALLFVSTSVYAQDDSFDRLVKQKKYAEALKIVCHKFPINCKKVKIKKPGELEEAYAVTANYTNSISLSESAFEYNGRPHEGWLAAIIGHENIHQEQSMYVRQVAGVQIRFLSNYYWEALLEYEAWAHMYIHSKRYQLSPDMLDEIKYNMDDFQSMIDKQ
ncbi:MAG: hypothetical protein COW00_13340 [Bdellovibrio sp. CG12_big_fil_rev_8_21_14_0_65_39_13]|nr:MAG: hypothetical protein COW78_11390 [Bdellovibrio sp. CG22_combo_CG10-13_8_21_14_all_39_27]PIQ58914.1 MAG: hypothetical protein COW00_13340 [Bdellovibrio sp. CG12_big_fil_rev_8_21_14_0_65_39_13]PIR36003.1 MAG: hypothetical protein COV37_05710 [Bdellovibrio sp. CG11_big_fil_rev_8_21_14_0_20_39_38]